MGYGGGGNDTTQGSSNSIVVEIRLVQSNFPYLLSDIAFIDINKNYKKGVRYMEKRILEAR